MGISRDILAQELDAQERDHGPSDDIELLRKALVCCQWSSDWQAVARVKWESTGPLSYQAVRRWYPTPMLRNLSRLLHAASAKEEAKKVIDALT